MTLETLSSNVVNYLVWRYLQEAGFGSAAVHLSQEWIRDPQTLPFAKNVKKHTLIELLQDGLYFDQIQSETLDSERRFNFGSDHGRRYSTTRNGGPVLHPDGDFTDASAEPNGINHDGTSRKAFRRKKKGSGPDRLNGDAMEVETNGIHLHSRGESEAIVSDVESPIIEEIPLPTTLSEGRNIDMQTEKVSELAPNTTIIDLSKPDTAIKHTLWNPHSIEKEILMTSGDSIFRFHRVPSSQNAETTNAEIPSRDIILAYEQFEVTAFCWKGPSEAAFATEKREVNENGETMITYHVNIMEGEDHRMINSSTGLVFQLRWNASSQLLLSLSSSGNSGSIRIWKQDSSPLTPLTTASNLFDAQWISDTRFIVCGDTFLKVFELDLQNDDFKVVKEYETTATWDKVCYDSVSDFFACKSMDGDEIAIAHLQDSVLQTLSFKDAPITDVEFQPIANPGSLLEHSPRLLAASSEAGLIRMWNVKQGFTEIYQVELEGRPANALAFSPDGFCLAAAGIDTVLIWNTDRGGMPIAQWHGTAEQWDVSAREQDEQEILHRLGWDADGKKLAFTLGNQVAVINFQR